MSFNELVSNFTNLYVHKKNINWKDYNGYVCEDCWKNQFNISENDSLRPNLYELWQFRKHKELFNDSIFFMAIEIMIVYFLWPMLWLFGAPFGVLYKSILSFRSY